MGYPAQVNGLFRRHEWAKKSQCFFVEKCWLVGWLVLWWLFGCGLVGWLVDWFWFSPIFFLTASLAKSGSQRAPAACTESLLFACWHCARFLTFFDGGIVPNYLPGVISKNSSLWCSVGPKRALF